MSPTYFAIRRSAGCLTCGDGDFVWVDSQAGEEETRKISFEHQKGHMNKDEQCAPKNVKGSVWWWEAFSVVNVKSAAAAAAACLNVWGVLEEGWVDAR